MKWFWAIPSSGFAARLLGAIRNFPTTVRAILDAFYVPTRYPCGLPDSIPARVRLCEAVGLADARAGHL